MAAIASIGLASILKWEAGGWLIIMFGLGYLAAGLIHFVVHRHAAERLNTTYWALGLCIVSDLFLVIASLLQLDIGDNQYPWLTITALLNGGPGDNAAAPSWWPQSALADVFVAANIAVFVPVTASWAALLLASRRRKVLQ
jgi:hypothetical protein